MLERSNGVPYYSQVMDYIVKKIEAHEYKVGDRLPSEHELASIFGISRLTARQAITKLANQGWVESIKGSGTFVKHRMPSLSFSLSEKTKFTDIMGIEEHEYTIQLLNWSKSEATASESEILKLNPGESVYRLEILRSVNGEAFQITTSIRAEKYYPQFEKYIPQLEKYHSLTAISKKYYGFQTIRFHTTIQTMMPTGHDIQYFPENLPILRTKTVLAHPLRYPVGINIGRMRGDLGEITIASKEEN